MCLVKPAFIIDEKPPNLNEKRWKTTKKSINKKPNNLVGNKGTKPQNCWYAWSLSPKGYIGENLENQWMYW